MAEQTPAGMPTAEDHAKLTAVADAGAKAAADAPTPEQATQDAKQAMRDERDRQQLPMSDEDLDKVATLLVGKTIAEFEQRGAFDPPPEPVAPSVPREAPPAPGAEDAAVAAGETPPPGAAPPDPAPQKRPTFAQRFMGLGS
jgi:hypothetical protein